MSSKDIYESGRFASSRYAAGRYRGIGEAVELHFVRGWTFDRPQTVFTFLDETIVFTETSENAVFNFQDEN